MHKYKLVRRIRRSNCWKGVAVSDAVDSGQRAAQWTRFTSEAGSRFSNRLEFQPRSAEPFAPQLAFHAGDGVALSRTVMPALRITNHGSSQPDNIYQIACADHESVFVTERGTLRLAPAELVICNAQVAGEWTVDQPYTAVAIHIEERLLRSHIPNPMALVGRSLELPTALNDILVRILHTCVAWSTPERFGAASLNVACSFLDLLALSPRAQAREKRAERNAGLRRTQIKNFIQRNYAQPGLSMEDVAAHLGVTPRYVRMALAPDGLTPSEYLRMCRLLAARRMLSSPAFADRSITEIAFECGFVSSSHFSTEFRKRFGRSPRNFRQSTLPEQQAALTPA
jgi:AraC-like DNA-binding protein